MPQNTTQTEPYFEIHRNFSHRYRCKQARRLGVPATTLTAWYAVMHDLASNAGTFGEFTTDVRAFEEAVGEPERYGTTIEDVRKDALLAHTWRLLAQAKLVEIIEGQPEPPEGLAGMPSEFRVKVFGMASRPRRVAKTDAERQAEKRARDRANLSASGSGTSRNVTDARDASRGVVMSRGSIHPSNCAVTPTSLGAVPDGLDLLVDVARQNRQIDAEERAALLSGAARAELSVIPWSESGERLHVTEGSGASASDPESVAAATSVDALGGAA